MGIKWRLTGLFLGMAGLAVLLFWVGESALVGNLRVDPRIVILALLLPAAIVYLYARNLAGRLEELHFGARRIAQKNFEKIVFADSSDEIGQFAEELNRLARDVELIVQKGTQEAHKMEAILAGMQEGIIAVDHVGMIALVNAAAEKTFGRRQEEVKLRYLFDLIKDSGINQIVKEVLTGSPPGNAELVVGERIVRVQVSPILSERGNPRGAVIVSYDVTELRRLEQMRTEFVANVSHELRTPITSIKGFVETLLDGAVEKPFVREKFLKIIQSEALRLQRLIDDLLALSNIENKEGRRSEGVPRVSFVQEAYEEIRPVIRQYAEAKGIELSVELSEGLPAIAIGEDLLSQLLLNLLENAVKYTAEGRVWLRGVADEECVHLEFGDTGCGIPKESLPRIFERFYRVDRARSREQGGTGLGLSIVKHIVEGSGGKISVISQTGVGTVFLCDLPRA